jgi:hypothetical protein
MLIVLLHLHPQDMFLELRQYKRSIGIGKGLLLPETIQPTVPIKDCRRGPHSEPVRSLLLRIVERECPGGTCIRRDYDSSACQSIQDDIRQPRRRLQVKKWEHIESVN